MPIRVIRTLEYIYINQEEFEKDIARWFVPPMGSRTNFTRQGPISIRSSVMFPESIADFDLTQEG